MYNTYLLVLIIPIFHAFKISYFIKDVIIKIFKFYYFTLKWSDMKQYNYVPKLKLIDGEIN